MNPRTRTLQAAFPQSRGLTLVEILIALLVLSIGLLGLAGLQTLSLQFNTSAYQRTQATALAYEMADRMRANRSGALAGAYDTALGAPQDCDPGVQADVTPGAGEVEVWLNKLACRLPQGTGAIERSGAGTQVTLTVQWHDSQGVQDMQFEFRTAL